MGKKKKEQISARLAAISSSAPEVSDGRIPPPRPSRGRPGREQREPVFRPGKLYLSKTHHVRCVIRNVSTGGVYVHLEGEHPLPSVVVLRFLQTGVTKKARVAWQKDIEAGLEFI